MGRRRRGQEWRRLAPPESQLGAVSWGLCWITRGMVVDQGCTGWGALGISKFQLCSFLWGASSLSRA